MINAASNVGVINHVDPKDQRRISIETHFGILRFKLRKMVFLCEMDLDVALTINRSSIPTCRFEIWG